MIYSLKGWIINICSAVIFITAVEMILPDNTMKKYGKFVLGLILVLVLIDPIIKLFNKETSAGSEVLKATGVFNIEKYDENINTVQDDNVDNTKTIFKDNLEKKCTALILAKYPKDTLNVNVEVDYNTKEKKYYIKSIQVNLSDGSIEKVRKVQVDKSDNGGEGKESLNNSKALNIKEVLSKELDVPLDIISVFKQ